MFFEETKNPQVHAWAKQFREALTAKQMLKPAKMLEAIKFFGSLAKKRTPEVIAKTLNWYCEHAGEEYVPRLVTARQFCERFGDVIRAMERSPDEEAEAISPEAQACADMWLSQTSWPIEVRTCLPAIVQRSLENYKVFAIKFCNHRTEGMTRLFQSDAVFTHASSKTNGCSTSRRKSATKNTTTAIRWTWPLDRTANGFVILFGGLGARSGVRTLKDMMLYLRRY